MIQNKNFFSEGYKRFYRKYFQKEKDLYTRLSQNGQLPKAMVIACSDSRVDPSMLMDTQPGDLFVVRNVANLIPPYSTEERHSESSVAAAMEFGIKVLKIPKIIILGHTLCGGIKALVEKEKDLTFVKKWIKIAEPALTHIEKLNKESEKKLVNICGRYSLLNSLKNALTFPWINELVSQNSLEIELWNFDLETGNLEIFDKQKQEFAIL